MKKLTCAVLATILTGVVWVAAAESSQPTGPIMSLSAAPPNRWVTIAESSTGWRDQPIFVYSANIKRIVMAGGYQTYGGAMPHSVSNRPAPVAKGNDR